MLACCVIERSARMRHQLTLPAPTDGNGLRETLIAYGMAVVLEISQPEVLATYRLAIVEAENAPDVALTIERHGRVENADALIGLLAAARDRGLLGGGEPAAMADLFQAVLMGGAILVRLLMRVAAPLTEAEARQRAEAATRSLFRLYEGGGR